MRFMTAKNELGKSNVCNVGLSLVLNLFIQRYIVLYYKQCFSALGSWPLLLE